ncbi:aminotransferase class V-fold PLP-dependent enzyme [Amycolatopsis pigmentata]|uniref:Aminotransferase class V-fold PLP-dependent enzyme n=1 Tax=Amycolatopsis pigmentata TaxID=450801 RepID=A0ABW5FNW2_9PSEU
MNQVTAPCATDDEPAEFLAHYPEYESTRRIDELRATEYRYLDHDHHVYLDYTGAGLASLTQYRLHHDRLVSGCFGNPHSVNPTSRATTELVEQTRAKVLSHLNASPEEYVAIFTPNASGACRLVGEAYPFGRRTRLVLTFDNHNSVNGIREFARARHARLRYVPLEPPELRISDDVLRTMLPPGRGLFAYPAQSNFSGVRHPLHWVDLAHERGYDVFLDAAAYLPTNVLDLGAVHPDFLTVSWYKLFGYPTGVGCLVARREALARLRRPWFSGGTIQAVSVKGDWHSMAPDEAAFEDGTQNYLSIPDVETGMSWLTGIGVELINRRVRCLTGWLLDRLMSLRHSNGTPMVLVYGPKDTVDRGGTVAFNFLTPDGAIVDERLVEQESAAADISLRAGCFCNPGAGEVAFDIVDKRMLRRLLGRRIPTIDEYLDRLGLPSGGAIRVSLGIVSSVADVQRFLNFAERTYRDRRVDTSGLAPRTRC